MTNGINKKGKLFILLQNKKRTRIRKRRETPSLQVWFARPCFGFFEKNKQMTRMIYVVKVKVSQHVATFALFSFWQNVPRRLMMMMMMMMAMLMLMLVVLVNDDDSKSATIILFILQYVFVMKQFNNANEPWTDRKYGLYTWTQKKEPGSDCTNMMMVITGTSLNQSVPICLCQFYTFLHYLPTANSTTTKTTFDPHTIRHIGTVHSPGYILLFFITYFLPSC